MKTIITEKPSVAREIAAVLNVSNSKSGYMEGGGYYITWAFGHLVELCPPEDYGWKEWLATTLPMLPTTFKLRPSHKYNPVKKSWFIDKGVSNQLEVIKKLFAQSDEIIVATDAGREGELIFRYIYEYLQCSKPFKRLWISSLTKKAILKGFMELSVGSKFDNLYQSAKYRSEADWVVGMNASRALSIAVGKGIFSLGRVQTPTLSIICNRFIENREFISTPYYTLKICLAKEDISFFAYTEPITEKNQANSSLGLIAQSREATILTIDKKEIVEVAPLLYDLTSLQRDANKYFSLSADDTLKTAQSLYEQQLISYPRTGSCYISEDVFETLPKLLSVIKQHPIYGGFVDHLLTTGLNKRAVNDEKITDHHAILITENAPTNLKDYEFKIYNLIVTRILEALSSSCLKDLTSLTIACAGVPFKATGSVITTIGWRQIRVATESVEEDVEETYPQQLLPELFIAEKINKTGETLLSKQTKPKPLLNEASLLLSMEMAGKNVEDETVKEALKDCGIGTPATRANIIETLLHRGYIEREKKLLLPTPKGLAVHDLLKHKPIASPELTGQWEKRLNHIAMGIAQHDPFIEDIFQFAKETVSELLQSAPGWNNVPLETTNKQKTMCPKCKKGELKKGERNYWCTAYKAGCDFKIWTLVAGKTITDKQINDLLQKNKTAVIKGFKTKDGKAFDASLILINNEVKFEFDSK